MVSVAETPTTSTEMLIAENLDSQVNLARRHLIMKVKPGGYFRVKLAYAGQSANLNRKHGKCGLAQTAAHILTRRTEAEPT